MLLHGQMQPREKAGGDGAPSPPASADVLVATTVIEVGIDVPNATVMLVEDAERYGISQLHQLRGRVGRGEHDVAVPAVRAEGVARGCEALAEHRDGFELAEIDLELRGEGEMIGTRQSGLAALQGRAAARRRRAARARARCAPARSSTPTPSWREPEHALLDEAVEAAYGAEALEPIPA